MQRFSDGVGIQAMPGFGEEGVVHGVPQIGEGLIPLAFERQDATQCIGCVGGVGMSCAESMAPTFERRARQFSPPELTSFGSFCCQRIHHRNILNQVRRQIVPHLKVCGTVV